MKAYVITITTNPESVRCAERCIASCHSFGLTAEIWPAITPAHKPEELFEARGWPVAKFVKNRYSRPLPTMACFLSHAGLWSLCARTGESVLIMEHDAVMVRPLPDLRSPVINLGAPSFGRSKQPSCGIGPLVSKPHLPGAHAYFVKQRAAERLLELAKTEAEPTDVFLSLARFPFIRESFPYSFECHDEVSTVQAEAGCAAKLRRVRIIEP